MFRLFAWDFQSIIGCWTSYYFYERFSLLGYIPTRSVRRIYGVYDRMISERAVVGAMVVGRGKQSTLKKLTSVPPFPSQMPQNLESNPSSLFGKPAIKRLTHSTDLD
jgi:hypothetical protein